MAIDTLLTAKEVYALKILQEGKIIEALHEEEPFYKLFKGKIQKGTMEGKKIIMSIRDLIGPAAVGAVAYNGSFRTAQKSTYKELVIQPKFVTGHIEMEQATMMAAKSEKGGFIKLWDAELDAKNRAMAQDLSRQFMGSGDGVVCQVLSVTDLGSTAKVFVDTASTAKGSINWVAFGDQLNLKDASNTYATITTLDGSNATATVWEVLDVDLENNWFTCKIINTATGGYVNYQPSTAPAAGDLFVRTGITFDTAQTADVDAASEEMVGLGGLIDDATTKLFGVDRSAVPMFRSRVRDCKGELLQAMDVVNLAKEVALKGGKPKACVVSYDTYVRLSEIGMGMRSVITDSSLDQTLGIKTIGLVVPNGGSIPIVSTKYCQNNNLYLVDTDYFQFRGDDPTFLDGDGNVMRYKPGTNAYQNILTAELFGMMALVSTNLNKSGKLKNFVNKE